MKTRLQEPDFDFSQDGKFNVHFHLTLTDNNGNVLTVIKTTVNCVLETTYNAFKSVFYRCMQDNTPYELHFINVTFNKCTVTNLTINNDTELTCYLQCELI